MAGKSPVVADVALRRALMRLSQSPDRGEADRARAVLLTLSGWTSSRIAEAFGVREDTVRFWRSAFMTGGVAALCRRVFPGPAPVKAGEPLACGLDLRGASAVAEAVLSAPVADRPNWTLPRLADEIARRSGVRISPSRLSVVLRQKGVPLAAAAAHAEGTSGPAGRCARRPAAPALAGPRPKGGHSLAVWRGSGSAHAPLPRPCLGRAPICGFRPPARQPRWRCWAFSTGGGVSLSSTPAAASAVPIFWLCSRKSIVATDPDPGSPPSRSSSSSTMARSIPARRRGPRLPPVRIGSRSSGSRSTPRSSTIANGCGAT